MTIDSVHERLIRDFHRHHRKRLGMCLRCLRRYPCGQIRAFESGYVVGWDAVVMLESQRRADR